MIWIVVFVVFSILILVHEAGHLIAAKRLGIRVEAFSLGMGKRLFGKKIGDTDYRISLIPFGGFCQMAGEEPGSGIGHDYEFQAKPAGHRAIVVAAGSITNYIFAFFLFVIIFMIGVPTQTNKVGQILQGYPAETSGLKIDDAIVAINGYPTKYWEDIVEVIKKEAKSKEKLSLNVEREDKNIVVDIIPDMHEVTNIFGQTISRPMIGIAPKNEIEDVKYNPIQAVYFGGKKLLSLTAMTYKGLWLMITGGMPLKSSAVGPIGIAHFIKDAANLGIVPLLFVMAYVSMALAVFNLLPFPVLDGGHIVFLFIEKIRKRPVDVKVQENIMNVAVVLIISFALFVSWQDLLKFTPLGKKMVQTEEIGRGSKP